MEKELEKIKEDLVDVVDTAEDLGENINENVFEGEAPQAPEFHLDPDNPLKWGDEVENTVPDIETPSWEDIKPEEPELGFEADERFEQNFEQNQEANFGYQENPQQTGWNNQGTGWNAQGGPQYGQAGPQYGQAGPQYGQASPYGAQSPYNQQYGHPYVPSGQKNKLAAGLLAILLGALGIHKFYLGMTNQGIIMLVVSLAGSLLCGLGPLVMSIIALVEGIIYLTKSDEEFYETYEVGKKPWF